MNQSFITREINVQDAGCESPMHILPIKITNNVAEVTKFIEAKKNIFC
jgi:hypothetical protein